MKQTILLLFVLVLPWKVVGAQTKPWQSDSALMALSNRVQADIEHRVALWAYLDSLYRASREKDTISTDSVRGPTWIQSTPGGVWLPPTWDEIYAKLGTKTEDTTIYIREIVPLDSVAIVRCGPKWLSSGSRSKYLSDKMGCDTLGWRITKWRETVIEVRE